jgi:hypothetical protein
MGMRICNLLDIVSCVEMKQLREKTRLTKEVQLIELMKG